MNERTLSVERVYEGRIVSLELHDVELHNGVRAKREIVRHGPAVAVVAELPDGRFVFVRQFRKPLDSAIVEVVAGNVEPGEDLEKAAIRELREETGYDTDSIIRIGAVYPSPGYVDERIELFYARLAGAPDARALDADEHVEVQIYTRDEVLALMDADQLQDGKTLAAWMLYERVVRGHAQERIT